MGQVRAMRSIDEMLEGLKTRGELLTEKEIRGVIARAKEIFLEECNVVHLSSPVTVAGDIHGQFYDLLTLFEIGGELPQTSYIFLGDYVDRGGNSVETLLYLVLLKLKWPSRITLLRGNHESRQITQVYGFYRECLRKYGTPTVWRLCTELFDYLVVGALVDQRVLCIHGGLSPEVKLLDDLAGIQRLGEIPDVGAFGDIVWSDPSSLVEAWAVNPRGAGYLFGERVANEFCHLNDLDLIARAHQLAMDGYLYQFDSVVTVWSAPNYCYRCGNVGAIMRLTKHDPSFAIFTQRPQTQPPPEPTQPPTYFL
ncbi:serine/threonine-protein phosphatase [Gregarina niphandrodes]|uniref:Serine/threonine-protein phosphatase n=1 Tax=Gregarina niphandrodes TaxID=110365 RepID=A0A023B3L5_GRENI|nr:serine/threonine-protein phosphatase [Gregarina niphandrodes]EZG55614.1 serine/threonine-protein phosphatase [Gregarina niphandrodes]|eukprot:XP_011131479.1 serine/threonine-protein phosphatase [Gregarina niphandrodes]